MPLAQIAGIEPKTRGRTEERRAHVIISITAPPVILMEKIDPRWYFAVLQFVHKNGFIVLAAPGGQNTGDGTFGSINVAASPARQNWLKGDGLRGRKPGAPAMQRIAHVVLHGLLAERRRMSRDVPPTAGACKVTRGSRICSALGCKAKP